MNLNRVCQVIILLLFITVKSMGQEIRINVGQAEIGINQAFTITITVENDKLRSYSPFPEINGLYKRGTSSSSSTSIINGKISSSQSITQNYFAEAEGNYVLQAFTMQINDKPVNSPGTKIKVGPAVQQRNQLDPFGNDPFRDFFGEPASPQEFMDIKEDAFFALTTDKDIVFVGEGFTATMAFYISDNNKAPMQFFDPAKQLSEILKKIKPANCWEENFSIENITPEHVAINGKSYSEYKIYQASYYPLNSDTIRFPSVPLKMIKYKVAKNPSFFGTSKLEDFKTFYSKPKEVIVKQLPPHPLRDAVAVGKYRLMENLDSKNLLTGKSFNYDFIIQGEGNISAINEPITSKGSIFDIYAPNIKQNINRSNGRVTGTKTFNYYVIPNEPGDFDLGKYFSFIYFNTDKKQYDTLRSETKVTVKGESKKNEQISANDAGSFYDEIDIESNKVIRLNGHEWIRYAADLFIVLMLGMSIYIYFKK